jgi:CRP/FNR family transcriptional regulator
VVDDLPANEVTAALIAGGVSVSREIERGALVLMNAREYAQPPASPTHMIDLMRERTRDARSRGFSGLRVAVEMTWTVIAAVPDETLVDIEALLDVALGPGGATVACMYRRGRFSTAVLQGALRTHVKVVAGDQVHVSLSSMFQGLTHTDLRAFLASADERRVPKGGYYFQQGEPSREVFVLTSGRLKGVYADAAGRNVIIGFMSPPETFGHVSALAGTPRFASSQALEDSRALVWDVQTVINVIMTHPKVSLDAVRFIAKETAAEVDHTLDLTASPVERRLARFLHRLGRSMGRKTASGILIEMGLSGEDLAGLINTTPYSISRVLAGWHRLKIVVVRKGRCLLLDAERLAAIAGEPGFEIAR